MQDDWKAVSYTGKKTVSSKVAQGSKICLGLDGKYYNEVNTSTTINGVGCTTIL